MKIKIISARPAEMLAIAVVLAGHALAPYGQAFEVSEPKTAPGSSPPNIQQNCFQPNMSCSRAAVRFSATSRQLADASDPAPAFRRTISPFDGSGAQGQGYSARSRGSR